MVVGLKIGDANSNLGKKPVATGGGNMTNLLSAVTKPTAPKPPLLAAANQPSAAQSYSAPSTGGGGGGGGGGAAAIAAPAAAPAPVKDVDWFNQDSVYRGAAGRSLADLTGQLANILAQRDQNYQQLGNNRDELADNRQQDLTSTGEDFAGRGLLGSGLYANYADDVAQDYAKQGTALDQQQQQIAQQYGQAGTKVDLSNVNGNNGLSSLASLYGLLGSMGLQAGNQYNTAISKAKADSAARSTTPLLATTNW